MNRKSIVILVAGAMAMLAIVVNGELAAAPIIQTEIDMDEFIITGKFTKEEAVNLAAALNSKNSEED